MTGGIFEVTAQFMELDETRTHLFQFGALTKSMPIAFERLDEIDPSWDELQIFRGYDYDKWTLRIDPPKLWQLCDDMILCRAVDAFDYYLASILRAVFRVQPKLLKSNATVRAEELLEFPSIEDVIEHLIARRVDDLSAKGLREILRYVRDSIGADLAIHDEPLVHAVEAVAVRNIVVHNAGRVDERFLQLTGREDLKIGQRFSFGTHEVIPWVNAVLHVAIRIDTTLIEKFSLPSFPLPISTRKDS